MIRYIVKIKSTGLYCEDYDKSKGLYRPKGVKREFARQWRNLGGISGTMSTLARKGFSFEYEVEVIRENLGEIQ